MVVKATVRQCSGKLLAVLALYSRGRNVGPCLRCGSEHFFRYAAPPLAAVCAGRVGPDTGIHAVNCGWGCLGWLGRAMRQRQNKKRRARNNFSGSDNNQVSSENEENRQANRRRHRKWREINGGRYRPRRQQLARSAATLYCPSLLACCRSRSGAARSA